ncbi:hypothetical protein [Streptomyces sp. NPDC060002]|uniref:hypothetical protein n=1 Tax=Streptomyces sp. NPDC060002 TaxID=3347033 RepID=UPI0036B64B77
MRERRRRSPTNNAFKKVTGKENTLFQIAEASLARPDEEVRQVVFPAATISSQCQNCPTRTSSVFANR